MGNSLSLLANNLLAPTILFFILGVIAAYVRSDLSIPKGAAKVMSIYLLFAIGFKGGVGISQSGISFDLFANMVAGIVLSFILPFVAFWLIRMLTQLDTMNAAAVAGHYGSISIVTFVTAVSILETSGITSESYMVAIAAVMEVPAIMSALWLASRTSDQAQSNTSELYRDILANGSIVLLVGSFLIGAITGQDGMDELKPFIAVPFTGVLCLFLLDMGLSAGRSLMRNRSDISLGLVCFGCLMPIVGAVIGLCAASLTGLSFGGTFLMMVLSASASYIAVPAAMQIALPDAKSGIYLSLSLGITFPFNLTVGLPLYILLATFVTG